MVEIAGGIVWNPKRGIVVVNQNNNSWSLPKGHVEADEDTLSAAIREIKEESGIPKEHLVLISSLGSYERDRIPRDPGDPPEQRRITLYLFRTDFESILPEDPENPEARWVPVNEVSTLLSHPKDKEIFNAFIPEIEKGVWRPG